MRRIARSNRAIGSLIIRPATGLPSSFLCSACLNQTSTFTSSSHRTDKNLSRTERLRQRIWGTDTPPGQKDLYAKSSVLDKSKQRWNGTEVDETVGEQIEEKVEEQAEKPVRRQRRVEATPTDLDPSYVAAESWDGLEEVGGAENYWREWELKHPYKSFIPPEVTKHGEVITVALHRAMVEVFAALQASEPLSIVFGADPNEDQTKHVQIGPGPILRFPESAPIERINRSFSPVVNETEEKVAPVGSEEDVAADRSNTSSFQPDTPEHFDETATKEAPTESEEDVAADRSTEDSFKDIASVRAHSDLIASWDPSWLEVSLENPEVKFAVLKRTMQLTGIRLSDSVIGSANTAKALLAHLITPPKPRKLVAALTEKPELISLPNVSIYPRRRTPVDKERSLGRWKVIEKELQEKGLPVFGH